MKELVIYYIYLFIIRFKKFVQVDIMGSKKLPSLIENIVSMFIKDHQLYRNEIWKRFWSQSYVAAWFA
jgi:hypothetical protein